MIRNRIPRYRNLQNLHVIPTAPSKPSSYQPPTVNLAASSVLITLNPTSSESEIQPFSKFQNISNQNSEKSMFNQNKPNIRKRRNRNRKRNSKFFTSNQTLVPNSNYEWHDPAYVNEENDLPPAENIEEVESPPEVSVEEDFEEVEVASVDGDGKQEVLVGFRSAKIHYLSYKKKCFFKPKIYNFGSQRTFVNCLNVQDNSSVDVDVVSEAEYELECDMDNFDQTDSQDKISDINVKKVDNADVNKESKTNNSKVNVKSVKEVKNLKALKNNSEIDLKSKNDVKVNIRNMKKDIKVEVKSLKKDNKVDVKKDSKVDVKSIKKDTCEDSKNVKKDRKVDEKSMKHDSKVDVKSMKHDSKVDVKSMKHDSKVDVKSMKHNSKVEVKSMKHDSKVNAKSTKHDSKVDVKSNTKESSRSKKNYSSGDVEAKREDNSKLDREKNLQNKESKSAGRIYKTYIEASGDISQGSSLIQKSLDSWKSHLIGLGYLIEIRKQSKDSSAEYYCVLCDEDLQVETFPAINVINHINGNKHIVKYLVKHFSSCGFNFAESSSSNVVLQKVCEEINTKLGYSYMCITNSDFSEKQQKKKIKDIVQNASHPDEKSLKLDRNQIETMVESDILKSVTDVLCSIIDKIATPDKNSEICESKPIPKKEEAKNKSKSPNALIKCKGNSALSSYLKLKYAKNIFKGALSFSGGHSKVRKETSTKNADIEKKELDAKATHLKSTKCEEETCVQDNADTSKQDIDNVEKMVQKPTVHSKHCRKRILGKETSRFKVTEKSSVKEEFKPNALNKTNVKSVSESGNFSSSKRIVSNRDVKYNESSVTSSHKSNTSRKVSSMPVKKIPRVDSKSSLTRYSKSPHRRIVHKKVEQPDIEVIMVKEPVSQWKVMSSTSNSPPKSPSIKAMLKSVTRKHSPSTLRRSPIERIVRGLSKSPVRRIKSPLRVVHRSPVRRHSRSPFRRSSRSPLRRKSRSPVRRRSRSPLRRHSRSPLRHRSRSPLRKRSRSPVRRHSRSPARRYARSPLRRHSRSPVRRLSRSPVRRLSRSPVRRLSRSPVRRYSRSPARRHSRSPARRHSRSPVRRLSRSPVRRYSRSPVKRHSRSPVRRHSRSPIRRHSRSPMRRLSKSPIKQHYESSIRRHLSPPQRHGSPISKHSRSSMHSVSKSPIDEYRSLYKSLSPSIMHSVSTENRVLSEDRFSGNVYNYDKRLGHHEREYSKIRSAKHLNLSVRSTSDKHKSFTQSSIRGVSDLDPVSDEDESVYFDKQQLDDIMTSSSSKAMLSQFVQKLSHSNVKADNPLYNKLMQFLDAHSAEVREFIEPHTVSKHGKGNTSKEETTIQEKQLIQQLFLSNILGNSQELRLSSPAVNMSHKYEQPPFLSENMPSGYGVAPNVAPSNLPQCNAPRFFPPNVSVPPPQLFRQFNQPHQEFSQKAQVPPEVAFKDLKATVNKLFGASEVAANQEKVKSLVSGYVTEPDPEKWDLNHPATPKFSPSAVSKFNDHVNPRFNAPVGPKNVFHSQGKNLDFGGVPKGSVNRAEMPVMFNNSNAPEQFYSGRGNDRPQMQSVPIPPPDAKVSFCDVPRGSSKGNLFPAVHNIQSSSNFSSSSHGSVNDVKVSLAQRLASVLVKVGMTDVPAPLLQEMLMKIGAFSSLPRQDITETEIVSILKRLGYLS